MVVDLRKRAVEFEQLIKMLFESLGYSVEVSRPHDAGYDMLATSSTSKLAIEVKYSKQKHMPTNIANNAAINLNRILKTSKNEIQPILVLSGWLSHGSLKSGVKDLLGIKVLDIRNILYLVNDFPELHEKLLNILEFSTNDIVLEEPGVALPNAGSKVDTCGTSNAEKLKNEVINWNSTVHASGKYEQLCIRVLKELFSDDLMLWKEQCNSNSSLYRFDLACKIKDNIKDGLWYFFQNFFNTKYIIFEFKNYSKQITQKEIYTTEKYLYLKALRGVAIIVSCKGEDSNAQKAIRGILREDGKIILSINNNDLIEMLEAKSNNSTTPSDYLFSKVDEMLIDLEK